MAYAIGRDVGSAVARNRARRRLRAAVRANSGALRSDRVYLFGAGRAAVSMDFVELRRTIRELLERLP